jgi:murein DD-endopeptidase MepM/ murein hydrolase activator NlpD
MRVLLILLAGAVLILGATVVVVLGPRNGAPTVPPVGAAAIPTPAATSGSSPGASSAPSFSPSAGPTPTPVPTPTPTSWLTKAIQPESTPPDQLTGYSWPLRDALITSRFAPRAATDGGFVIIDGQSIHDGLDIATHCGDRIRAAHDGTVLYAGRDFDPFFGYWGDASQIYARLERLGRVNTQPIVIVIDDGNGYRSVYVHLSEADVAAGDVVQAGDIIGLEGMTGFATGCHLHYGLIRMDGAWLPVVPRLAAFGYPPYARERVDPLNVLPWGDPYAPLKLREKVGAVPSPSPGSSSSPAPTPTLPSPSPSA